MDAFTLNIISGVSAALSAAKTMLTNPILVNTDATQGDVYSLPLECETFQEEATAEVSDSMVIVFDGKQKVTDNIAPGPTSWSLTGYIPGSPAEVTNLFTPFVALNTSIARGWFKSGAVLKFKDMDCHMHERVVIKNLKLAHDKECRNKTPFTMTLQEINVMDRNTAAMTDAQANATPAEGTLWGAAETSGTTYWNTIKEYGSIFKDSFLAQFQ